MALSRCCVISSLSCCLSSVVRFVESFWMKFWIVFWSLILVCRRVMGFPWCPFRLDFSNVIVFIVSVVSVLCIAVWTFSVSSVAWANALMSMYAMGCLEDNYVSLVLINKWGLAFRFFLGFGCWFMCF